MTETKPTHTAYALKREGRRQGRWLEIGTARLEATTGVIHLSLDRLPLGGFNGYAYLSPVGQLPPLPEPVRPGGEPDEDVS